MNKCIESNVLTDSHRHFFSFFLFSNSFPFSVFLFSIFLRTALVLLRFGFGWKAITLLSVACPFINEQKKSWYDENEIITTIRLYYGAYPIFICVKWLCACMRWYVRYDCNITIIFVVVVVANVIVCVCLCICNCVKDHHRYPNQLCTLCVRWINFLDDFSAGKMV